MDKTRIVKATLLNLFLITTANATPQWSGWYGGLNAGLVNQTQNMTDNQASSFNATLQQTSNPRLSGGLQLGYRRLLDGGAVSGVYGAEWSLNFTNASVNKVYGSPFANYHFNVQNELKYLSLLQFIGGINAERTLLFLAAGLSYVDIDGKVRNKNSIAFFTGFDTGTRTIGTAIGAGIEYAYTPKLSFRLKFDLITPNVYTVSNNAGDNYQITNSIMQGTFGINYHFDKLG